MPTQLKISLGQYTSAGRKETNQDFHGAYVPEESLLSSKGIAIALADGISTSNVSRIASEAAVKAFLDDYYCTSAAWSVKRSAQRVLMAVNSWLYAQTRQSPYRYDQDRGYVCTLSAIVLKATTAHLFHAGDARIYRMRGDGIEQLTEDHRLRISPEQSHLSRALGVNPQIEIDYSAHSLDVHDVFVIATDGVHEYLPAGDLVRCIHEHANDLDAAAKLIVEHAYERGSTDNLTVQIVRVDELGPREATELHHRALELPLPPPLEPRMEFDGYRIVRELHISHRSHVYLAMDEEDGARVVIKVPSTDLRADPVLLERFLMEDWIARRLDHPHVLRAHPERRKRSYLYTVTEYIEGQTLTQWMLDHPKPSVEAVRGIVEQIANGLTAFHRLEMLHQDLRPDNVMIDRTGSVKLIDFGAARVAGIAEAADTAERSVVLGTVQYTAPEYFIGEEPGPRSDQYSLGVIAYQLLSGRLPYGTDVAKARSKVEQRRLRYRSVLQEDRQIPVWLDEVLRKATHPEPFKRYEELSEFVHDLRHPPQTFLARTRTPLLERDPAKFWKIVAFVLALLLLIALARQ
jgi:serine/threonine protein phosphatase PrpC